MDEEQAMKLYGPVTHALMVVKVEGEYLPGRNPIGADFYCKKPEI